MEAALSLLRRAMFGRQEVGMSGLDLKVPPDFVWLTVAGAMWLASVVTPGLDFAMPVRIGLAAVLAVPGIGIVVAGRVILDRSHTTWHPTEPSRTTQLVTSGVYAFSRNPIYLGMLLVLVGWAALLASPFAVLVSAAFVVYMDRFQIGPEERALAALLGREYDDYVRRVRRWL
jgi:protein-S-isoprenylcysteine O-methyltransferase Ste14